LSRRWNEPLITLNCAALAPTLIADELFGHEAGAYTGATGLRQGRFEAADDGTFFLDEIGNIPVQAQEKILRVVEYGSFERVGSSVPIQVDVRIVAATHADLPAMAEAGRFKRDLLDRLSFEVLFLPPLRQRSEDILLLASHFAARMAHELGREEVPEFSDQAMADLLGHDWPGNVRELKNAVERAVYAADSARIDAVSFDPFRSPWATQGQAEDNRKPITTTVSTELQQGQTLPEAVRQLEIELLQDALKKSRYHQRRAARVLGLSYHQFRGLYRKYAAQLKELE
jgi:psp operon transcriptional activator